MYMKQERYFSRYLILTGQISLSDYFLRLDCFSHGNHWVNFAFFVCQAYWVSSRNIKAKRYLPIF